MRILRDTVVAERIGCRSRATVWRIARRDPTFPRPVRVSAGITGWLAHEVDAWLARRAEASRDER
ncbi:MAG: AlpA family phage regulatory protein [Gammaproteobacteria bacterium]|nr:AlpA family phage regulatory protein [Gammaproteobacteria bacterium]